MIILISQQPGLKSYNYNLVTLVLKNGHQENVGLKSTVIYSLVLYDMTHHKFSYFLSSIFCNFTLCHQVRLNYQNVHLKLMHPNDFTISLLIFVIYFDNFKHVCLAHFIFVTLFFRIFGHISCVIFFKFVSVLNFCLAHLALLSKKVNKHDYVIFSYFRNFVDQNEKQKME